MATSRRSLSFGVPAPQPSCAPTADPSVCSGSASLREFLLPTPARDRATQLSEGKELFRAFIADFLRADIPKNFLQAGWGNTPDQILINTNHGSTLCVPVNILCQPTEIARALVQAKICQSEQAFQVGQQ